MSHVIHTMRFRLNPVELLMFVCVYPFVHPFTNAAIVQWHYCQITQSLCVCVFAKNKSVRNFYVVWKLSISAIHSLDPNCFWCVELKCCHFNSIQWWWAAKHHISPNPNHKRSFTFSLFLCCCFFLFLFQSVQVITFVSIYVCDNLLVVYNTLKDPLLLRGSLIRASSHCGAVVAF